MPTPRLKLMSLSALALTAAVTGLLAPAAPAPAAILIDDFESYNLGQIDSGTSGVATPPWYANTSTASIEADGGSNQMAGVGWSGARGAARLLPTGTELADGDTATYFWRVRHDSAFPVTGEVSSWGLSYAADVDTNRAERVLDNYEVLIAITADGQLAAGNGTNLQDLMEVDLGQWVNVWVDVDNDNDTFDVYANTSAFTAPPGAPNPADLLVSDFAFRNAPASQDLVSFLTAGAGQDVPSGDRENTKTDDIYLIPEPASLATLAIGGLVAFARRRPGQA